MAKAKTEKAINIETILFNCRDILRAARNSGAFFEKRDMMLTLVFLRFIGEKYEDGIEQLKETLKAIQASGLGLNPSDDGKVIRLFVPAPTEERRVELVKMVKKIAEDTRVNMRNARRDTLDQFKALKKNGEITEGDLAMAEKEVQKILDNAINNVNKALDNKEKDIMEV